MPEEKPVGCARPTGGPVGGPETSETPTNEPTKLSKEKEKKMVHVGKKAPDFVAPCYKDGAFSSVKLSDYLGKWVVLCFYPGDFTFV